MIYRKYLVIVNGNLNSFKKFLKYFDKIYIVSNFRKLYKLKFCGNTILFVTSKNFLDRNEDCLKYLEEVKKFKVVIFENPKKTFIKVILDNLLKFLIKDLKPYYSLYTDSLIIKLDKGKNSINILDLIFQNNNQKIIKCRNLWRVYYNIIDILYLSYKSKHLKKYFLLILFKLIFFIILVVFSYLNVNFLSYFLILYYLANIILSNKISIKNTLLFLFLITTYFVTKNWIFLLFLSLVLFIL